MNSEEIKDLHAVSEYWQTHDSADSFEESERVSFRVDLRRNLLHPRLLVLTHRPKSCPRCQSPLEEILIEYVTSSEGRIFVVRDVPALRCQASSHEFLLAETLDQLEHLIGLDGSHQIEPEETLRVPVFSLRKSA